jgi:hypothetical protein
MKITNIRFGFLVSIFGKSTTLLHKQPLIARMSTDSEIYNEKIYDLLESPIPAPAPSTSSVTSTNAGGGMFSGFSQGAKNLFKFPTVKRSALSLKADKAVPAGGSAMGQTFKVVAGMKEIRVHSAEVSLFHGVPFLQSAR